MRLSLIVSGLFTIFLGACGTLVEGQTQRVKLVTPGAPESRCTLDNGVRYPLEAGQTAEIMRSHNDLVVDCYASGNRHKVVTVPSGYNNWSTANVLNGAVPGYGYDHFSGGLYEYPEVITIDFVGVPTRGFETPNYHNKDAPNPYTQAIENYGPTVPKTTNDSDYLSRGLQKRTMDSSSNPFATSSDMNVPPPSPGAVVTPMPTPAAPKGANADELTRSMNPSVFNP